MINRCGQGVSVNFCTFKKQLWEFRVMRHQISFEICVFGHYQTWKNLGASSIHNQVVIAVTARCRGRSYPPFT